MNFPGIILISFFPLRELCVFNCRNLPAWYMLTMYWSIQFSLNALVIALRSSDVKAFLVANITSRGEIIG